MKAFAAMHSDLSGGLNPTGVWSPEFIRLKKAIEGQVDLPQLEHAFYDWVVQRGLKESELDRILELPPDQAVVEFGHRLKLAVQTGAESSETFGLLRAAFRRLYSARVSRAAQQLEKDYIERRTDLRSKATLHGLDATPAHQVVEAVLSK